MSYEEFKKEVMDYVNNSKPKSWRIGQAVFNYIDENYGVARDVQFKENVDCFYDDNRVGSFIKLAFNRITKEA